MNRLAGFCMIALYAFTANEAEASKKTEVSYRLSWAWLGGDHVYVSYGKDTTEISYGLFDFNGTVERESSEDFYQKLAIGTGSQHDVVDFAGGTPADGLIYVDDDFKVLKKNTNISVSTSSEKFNYACNVNIWGESNPVRFDDRLFYCGSVIPVFGKGIAKLSADVEQKIENFAREKISFSNSGGIPQVTTCAANGRELDVSVIDPGGIKGKPLDFVKIDIDTLGYIGIQTLPFESSEFRVVNHFRGSFNNGMIVEKRTMPEGGYVAYLCRGSDCSKYSMPQLYSYILIDDSRNQVILFKQANAISKELIVTKSAL
jgi:hypothetical protein